MAYFVEIYCRLAIRLCVGYHANGREKYKTLEIPNVRRDASAEDVAAFVRALEPLLDGRVVRVLLIRRDRLVVAGAERLPFAVTARSAATWQSHTTETAQAAEQIPEAEEVMDAVIAGVGEAGDHWSPLHSGIIINSRPQPEVFATYHDTQPQLPQLKTIMNVGANSVRPLSRDPPDATRRDAGAVLCNPLCRCSLS